MLLTRKYRELLLRDHADHPNWGTTGARYVDTIHNLCFFRGTRDLLDYGCGKGRLSDALNIPCSRYDPGIPEHSDAPRPHDIVVSTDVLEHVEPDCVDAVLAHLRALTKVAGFHAISTAKAAHILPDGRNAHLSIHPASWWKERLEAAGFHVKELKLHQNAPRYEEIVYTVEVT